MSTSVLEKIANYFGAFIAFVILVVVLGALLPEYFGMASKILTENLGGLAFIFFLALIFYLMASVLQDILRGR